MNKRVPELTDHLGYWLRQLSNHVSHEFARKLAGKDVTVAEWGLMRMMFDRDATPPSVLAADMGLSRGAVTKLADRLIAKGYAAREANPDDRRAKTLRLTRRGQDFLPELAALADRNEQECFAPLSAAERRALHDMLAGIVSRLGLTKVPID